MAMIVVMTVMIVLVLLTMVVFNQAVAQLPLARHDQDHESALHAAESGVDDYINHLNANNNYFALGNADGANGAFTGWFSLPGGATVATNEFYRYSVDTSVAATTGVVYLTSSGCAASSAAGCSVPGAVIRTVKLGLRKLGFLDFVYFTDYEIFDPLISGLPTASCNYHEWEANTSWAGNYGPDTRGSTCLMGGSTPEYIRFVTGDSLNGPVHSNDAFHICGTPVFGSLDSGYDLPAQAGYKYLGPNKYIDVCPTSPARTITGHNEPFPATNLLLSNQADTTVVGTSSVGCQYYGQTTITLHMNAGAPVMDVLNPYFIGSGKPAALQPTGPTGFNCGTTLAHLNLPLPAVPSAPGFNGVIYVKSVPSLLAVPANCSPSANCLGDVSVQGVLGGQMTIGADNNVNVTGNILYNGPGACNAAAACQLTGTDVLGLVAGNDVKIQHPSGCPTAGCLPNLTIDAAMLSVQHSIYVENWGSGAPMGLLNVYGTLAQRYRGVVGTSGGTGYLKNYNWDSRLRYLSPPYFLSPAQSSWQHISFAELKPTATP